MEQATTMAWMAAGLLLVFWALGAYNRLVRLRAAALAAFAHYAARAQDYVAFVRAYWGGADEPQHGEAQAALVAAAEQFDRAVRTAGLQPLMADVTRPVGLAYEVLDQCWRRIADASPDLAGPRLPQALQREWERAERGMRLARMEFNEEVQAYNDALALWPTRLLVGFFGLQPAQPL